MPFQLTSDASRRASSPVSFSLSPFTYAEEEDLDRQLQEDELKKGVKQEGQENRKRKTDLLRYKHERERKRSPSETRSEKVCRVH